jgi:hypothetical protein
MPESGEGQMTVENTDWEIAEVKKAAGVYDERGQVNVN